MAATIAFLVPTVPPPGNFTVPLFLWQDVVQLARGHGLQLEADASLAEIVDLSQGVEHIITRCLALALEHQAASASDQLRDTLDEENQKEEGVVFQPGNEQFGEAELALHQSPTPELDFRLAFMDDEVRSLSAALSVLREESAEEQQPLVTAAGRRVFLTRSEQVLYFDVLSLLTEPEPEKWTSQTSSGTPAIPVEQLLQTFVGREAAMLGLIQKGRPLPAIDAYGLNLTIHQSGPAQNCCSWSQPGEKC